MEPHAPPAAPGQVAAAAPAVIPSEAEQLLRAFLAGRGPRTLRAYAGDLADFARWSKAPSPAGAARLLLAAGPGGANHAALSYRAGLLARGLAAATVNRRLAALRSLVKVARLLGMVAWQLDVEAVPSEALRDTRGRRRWDARAAATASWASRRRS